MITEVELVEVTDQQGWAKTASQELSLELERLVSVWLSTYFAMSPNRIVQYTQNDKTWFRELDAVALVEGEPRYVFEIKSFTSTKGRNRTTVVTEGRKQLREVLEILKVRWPQVEGYLIALGLFYEHEVVFTDLNTNPTSVGNETINLRSEELWAWGLEKELIDNPQLLEEVILERKTRLSGQKFRRTFSFGDELANPVLKEKDDNL